MHKNLEQLLQQLDLIHSSSIQDCSLFLFDSEKLIGVKPGRTFDLGGEIGEPLSNYKHMLPGKVFTTGERLTEELEKGGLIKVPLFSVGLPIRDENNNTIGVYIAAYSTERFENLKRASSDLVIAVEEMNKTTNQIAIGANNVSERIQDIAADSKVVINDIGLVQSILSFVQAIAKQSHLLGLNAAIEAARAGEHGRGFNVVAKEIRTMAEHSKNSAQNSKEKLDDILLFINRLNDAIQQIAIVTQEHSAGLQQLSAAYAQIASFADLIERPE